MSVVCRVLMLLVLFAAFMLVSGDADASHHELVEGMDEKEIFANFYSLVQALQGKEGEFSDLGCDDACMALLKENHINMFDSMRETLSALLKSIPQANSNNNQGDDNSQQRVPTLHNVPIPDAPFYSGTDFDAYVAPLKAGPTVTTTQPNVTTIVHQNVTLNETSGEYIIVNTTETIIGPPITTSQTMGAFVTSDENGSFLGSFCDQEAKASLKKTAQLMSIAVPILGILCDSLPSIGAIIACAAKAAVEIGSMGVTILLDMIDMQNGMVRYGWIAGTNTYLNTVFDAVKCTPVARSGLPLQGCNGADDNCNFQIDECDEDTVPPTIIINKNAVGGKYFNNVDAAKAMAAAAVQAKDDCNAVFVSAPTLSGSCDNTVASMVASDPCANTIPIHVPMKLDVTPPTITCSALANRLSPANRRMTNVGFSYTATDDCCDPTVEVTVMMDEPMAPNTIGPAAMFLRDPATGAFQGIMLRAEAYPTLDGRVYTIYAKATDLAGNTATCIAKVEVPVNSNPTASDSGPLYMAPL